MIRPLSRTKAHIQLRKLKDEFRDLIASGYESKAKSCVTCETKGSCCLDIHFVNVRVSRLEAEAILKIIRSLPAVKRMGVEMRVTAEADRISRSAQTDSAGITYACPLFDRELGCVVHNQAKPLPCIAHGCYERKEDLPPDDLITGPEERVARLNVRVYRTHPELMPIPIAIERLRQADAGSRQASSRE